MAKPLFLYPAAPYLSSATVTATDSYAGTDPEDVLQSREDTYWRPADTVGSKALVIDFAVAIPFNAIALSGEGLNGVTVTIEADDNAGFSSPVVLANAVNLLATINAAWQPVTASTYRYLRLTFSSFGSNFRVAWVCAANSPAAPYLKSWDGDNVGEAGKAIVSPSGLYQGSDQARSMRHFPLAWGYVTPAGYAALQHWAAACIEKSLPFFLVPDSDLDAVYFGWLKDNKFSAPKKTMNGLHQTTSLIMITRAA